MNTIASPFRTSLPLLLNRLIPTWNVFYSYFQSNLAISHLLLPRHLSSRPLRNREGERERASAKERERVRDVPYSTSTTAGDISSLITSFISHFGLLARSCLPACTFIKKFLKRTFSCCLCVKN